jgi:hypothetical protein
MPELEKVLRHPDRRLRASSTAGAVAGIITVSENRSSAMGFALAGC